LFDLTNKIEKRRAALKISRPQEQAHFPLRPSRKATADNDRRRRIGDLLREVFNALFTVIVRFDRGIQKLGCCLDPAIKSQDDVLCSQDDKELIY
jgi:hypothetical protein